MKAIVKDAVIESAIMRQRAKSAEEKHADYSVEGNASDFMQRVATQPIRVAAYSAAGQITRHKEYPTKRNTHAPAQQPDPPSHGNQMPCRTVHLTQNPAYRPAAAAQSGFYEEGRKLFEGKVKQRRAAAQSLQNGGMMYESDRVGQQTQPVLRTTTHGKKTTTYPTTGSIQTPSAAQKAAMTDAYRVKHPVPASAGKKTVAAKTSVVSSKASPANGYQQRGAASKADRRRALNKTSDKAWVQQQAKERGKKKAQKEAAKKAKRYASKGAHSVATATKSTVGTVRKILHFPGKVVSAVMRSILLVCMVFGIFSIGSIIFVLGTSYGIFAAGDGGLREVVNQINTEYEMRLRTIREEQVYDELDMSGAQSDWRTVLSIYAVLVTTDRENPTEVVSMDEVKENLLREIFWKMNSISWELGTIEVPDPDYLPSEDEPAALALDAVSQPGTAPQIVPLIKVTPPLETMPPEPDPPTIEQTVLYITILHQTAGEMARFYEFTDEQKAQLEELLLPDNALLWNDVIYGISTGGNGEIVAVAASQVGNYNGNPYWTWYGSSKRIEWCAVFVSWCANECGYIDAGIAPRTASPDYAARFFKEKNRWCGNSYTPSPGDIIFFDWPTAGEPGSCDHIGIVEYVEEGIVHTIEGNMSNSVTRRQYPLGDSKIVGYGVPDVDSMTTEKEGEPTDVTPVQDTGTSAVQRPAVLLHPQNLRRAAAAYKRQRQYWKTAAV